MHTSNQNDPSRPRVVVLGAGYAGLTAALRAAAGAAVTVVSPTSELTERVRQHELAAGRPSISHPLAPLLAPQGVEHVPARATSIDTARRTVTTDDGRVHPYDRLVYALGSRTRGPAGDGDGRVFTSETAAYARKRLADGPGKVVVVGGGATGIETATELAERTGWAVELHTAGTVGPSLSARGRAHVRTVLDRLGVGLTEGVTVAPGDIDADVVVWNASLVAATELAADAGLRIGADGRIVVDELLRSVSHPDVYAAGDAAGAWSAGAGTLRMACATALPTGARAGRNVAAELAGRDPAPLRFRYRVQCLSLGREDGLVQVVGRDDSPRDVVLTGRPAAAVKEQVVRSTVRTVRWAAR
ncbi:FAD-dependent oxidoreductase [Cellulomonas cellasea]|uniref:NADH dehydrogenase FAD-containing subunit n=1 Tax=Cellulomonas cellasea TaxID=43670 RepID=A0A7W4UG26_9CELL|nr:FAD-dependent oxidoreductase [Cellulomonas cellasea]MBB2923517.1 NADH dehydrogenase FAD-containing subunit [Cellulomonas cellasea]